MTKASFATPSLALVSVLFLGTGAATADEITAHDGSLIYSEAGATFAGTPLEEVTPENFDPAAFTPLVFPFSKDATRVWSGSSLIAGADAATFEVIASNQAREASTYFFRESYAADVPYSETAEAYPDCFGWANIDGAIHYGGNPRDNVDPESYQCIDFLTSADRSGIYVYGSLSVSFEDTLDINTTRMLSNSFVTDGNTLLWIGDGKGVEISGLDLETLKVISSQEITDKTSTVFLTGTRTRLATCVRGMT